MRNHMIFTFAFPPFYLQALCFVNTHVHARAVLSLGLTGAKCDPSQQETNGWLLLRIVFEPGFPPNRD